ncbi:MAG: hypothetical protein QOI96_166, partial [Verrucomicrobiota bacterium]
MDSRFPDSLSFLFKHLDGVPRFLRRLLFVLERVLLCHSERSRGISRYYLGMLVQLTVRDVSTSLDMTKTRYLLSSSMRKIGASARLRSGSGKIISGSILSSAACAFSSVFIFMNRHSPQKQFSVGPGMKTLS